MNPANPADDETSALAGPGRQVGAGRFTLERLLGQGAMGAVWLAEDGRLKEKVALKFVPPTVRHDQAALDGLRREAQRSHRLAHPNIIRIHDFHEPPHEEPFISMEFVEGRTLSELRWSEPQKCLSWEKLLPLVKQLCDALDYAHGEGVVHRDLKPANLMLDAKGRLKLADFGLAMVIHESLGRASGQVALGGTLAYMSPQQVAAKAPAPADDIYSLGATLYELLASHPPFFRGDISYQTVHEAPPPLRERQAEFGIHNPVPLPVAETIMACLEKDPGRRPRSAGEAWGLLGGQPAARPEPVHRKIRVYAGAGALLVLMVTAIVLTLRPRSETEAAPTGNTGKPPATAATTTNGNRRVLLEEDFENFGPPLESKTWDWSAVMWKTPESSTAGKAIVAEGGNRYLQLSNENQRTRLITSPRMQLPEDWAYVIVTFRVRTRNLDASKSYEPSGAKVALDWFRDEGNDPFQNVGSSPPIKRDKDWSWERIPVPRNYVPNARSLRVYPFLDRCAGTAEFDDIRVVVTEQPTMAAVLASRVRGETEPAPRENPVKPPSYAVSAGDAQQQVLLSEDFENFGPPDASEAWNWRARIGGPSGSDFAGKNIVAGDGSHYLQFTNDEQKTRLITSTKLRLPENWVRIVVTFRLRTRDLRPSESYEPSGAKVGVDLLDGNGQQVSTHGTSIPMKKDSDWIQEGGHVSRASVPAAQFVRVYPFLDRCAGTAEFDDLKVVVFLRPSAPPAE